MRSTFILLHNCKFQTQVLEIRCDRPYSTLKAMDCAKLQLSSSVLVGRNDNAPTAYLVLVPELDATQVTGKILLIFMCS